MLIVVVGATVDVGVVVVVVATWKLQLKTKQWSLFGLQQRLEIIERAVPLDSLSETTLVCRAQF